LRLFWCFDVSKRSAENDFIFPVHVIFPSPSLLLTGEGKPAVANLSVNIDFQTAAPSAQNKHAKQSAVYICKRDTQQKVNQISNFCSPLSELNKLCVAHRRE
jgi:hypothetical protein